MDWKQASSHYQARLSEALKIQEHALNLANLPQAEVPVHLQEKLIQEAEPARRQLKRLEEGQFKIAVVGLEKAGKSTFINAWLECDLLPAKGGRCTFTTTQIYSVKHDSEQRLEVQVKTEEQFTNLLNELEQAKANEDIKTIRDNAATLQQVRTEGHRTFPFSRLEDIKDSLKKYVADEKYAHSVLEARLYTNKLAQAEGVVFYDVPGLDSGLAKHVDEAREMLSDCDAVILVQRFTSLREKELDIIKFTEIGDKNIKVSDKLFVFLSRIDSLGSKEALKTHIEEASQDWWKRAKLPKERIVSGCAGAYLLLNGLATEQTKLEIGDVQSIQAKLQSITEYSDRRDLIADATGIPIIKNKIANYINTERVSILKKRCDVSINTIVSTAEEIYSLVCKRYPEDPEDAKRVEADRQRILFTEWWNQRWEEKKADLQSYYESNILNKKVDKENTENSGSSLGTFEARYLEIVNHEIKKLKAEILNKKEVIFAANSYPEFDRMKANYAWREDLYGDVSKLLSTIAKQLAGELKDEALKLVEHITDLLWGSSLVKNRLIEKSEAEFLAKLETGLSVLFLRFARPVAEVLIRAPLDSDARDKISKSIGVDIELIDNYYIGEEPAFKVLKKYAKYGYKLLYNPDTRKQILGITGNAAPILNFATEVAIDVSQKFTSPEDDVIFEVENDINALAEYLCAGIFHAAGFESYCIQELKDLIDSFRDKKGTWDGEALNQWERGNLQLLKELPVELRSQEYSLEVSERLRLLATALKKTPTKEARSVLVEV